MTDTFGCHGGPAADALTLFTLDVRGGAGRPPWSVLFPSVVDSRVGAAAELDRAAARPSGDMCWAIERQGDGPAGTVVDRDAAAAAGRRRQPRSAQRPPGPTGCTATSRATGTPCDGTAVDGLSCIRVSWTIVAVGAGAERS